MPRIFKCPAAAETQAIARAFQATIAERLRHQTLRPLHPDALPPDTDLLRLHDALASCGISPNELSWARGLVKASGAYRARFDGDLRRFQQPVPARYRAGNTDPRRKRIVFFDTGLTYDDQTWRAFEMTSAQGQRLNLLGSLSEALPWDAGDLDDNPATIHDHGEWVMKESAAALARLHERARLHADQFPLLFPVKIWNHYDLVNFAIGGGLRPGRELPPSTDFTHLHLILRAVAPRLINMSGAFSSADPARYVELRNELVRLGAVLVAAAGNQRVNLDEPGYPFPWPAKLTDPYGHRLSNVVVVTTVDEKLNVTGNWGPRFVDAAVIAPTTSQAAAHITTVLHVAYELTPGCEKTKRPADILRALSKRLSNAHGIPVIEPSQLSRAELESACRK
ncbi:MAG TPA: hypothetical protein VFV50_17920 [Bdellovibrionales bacterium]|nr:hypothetical protein [Bdellovibrionales bacterium]